MPKKEKTPLTPQEKKTLPGMQLPVWANGVRMELFGNRRAVVEGCTGILEYEDSVVRIRTGKMLIRFTGRNLRIVSMNQDTLVLEGFLLTMEYIT